MQEIRWVKVAIAAVAVTLALAGTPNAHPATAQAPVLADATVTA
jgi:hypothetical protein